MVYNFFICCWIGFADVLLRIFASVFIRDNSSLFFCDVFGFGIKVILASKNELGSFPSCCLEVCEELVLNW